MNKEIINEGLDYHDFKGEIYPALSVDEYSAKVGDDSDIVTLAFTVKGEQVGIDLADWLEKGYDYVLDAQVSEGETDDGNFLVFVELDRRTRVPERIIEMLDDLETLTDLSLKEWTIMVDDKKIKPDEQSLKAAMILSPHEYRTKVERENELNEMREIAGIESKTIYNKQDPDIKNFKNLAGL